MSSRVEADDPRPVGRPRRARAGVHGRDRGLHRRARDRRRERAADQASPSAICVRSQRERSWSASSTTRRRRRRARRARVVSSISARGRSPRARRASAREQRASRIASSQSSSRTSVAGGREVALVEDEVERASTDRRRSGRSCSAGHRVGDAGVADLALRAHEPLRHRRLAGTRKARAISAVASPPSVRSVSATRASGASAGWQQVKISRSRSSGIGASSRRRPRRVGARSASSSAQLRVRASPRGAGGRSPGCERRS